MASDTGTATGSRTRDPDPPPDDGDPGGPRRPWWRRWGWLFPASGRPPAAPAAAPSPASLL
ncbi:MAG TPA: hypothetical protein VJ890_25620, partial [Vineibacter sp.]|nr:hypothetical protein [Vineibacter sp.]